MQGFAVFSPHGGWQDGLEVDTLVPELSHLGLNPDTAINCHRGVSQIGKGINVCAVLRMNVQLGIKDPMESFSKSRRAITGTLAKFQIFS